MKKYFILLIIILFYSCSSNPQEKEQPFTVDLDSPRQTIGSAETYLEGYLGIGGLKKSDITVYYYPADDAVCLNFKAIQYITCNQFWDKESREVFIKAFERYKEDYAQRALNTKKGRKTRGVYGEVQGYFTWKKTSVAVQAYGTPKIKLGYQIRGQSAFFTTTQMESHFEDQYLRNENSPIIVMYFTRAQAENLIELLKR